MARPIVAAWWRSPVGASIEAADRTATPGTSTGAPSLTYRPEIEGLRAIAVLCVVLYHCGVGWMSGGYIGVDVFFVLSGFLITSLMVSEISTTGRLSLSAFYGRRARRLLPAATLVIAATVAIGWFVLPPLTRRDLVGDAVSATTYSVNWRFARSSTDYFQSELEPSALQHYWSLAVEEQFYIVWPVFIALLAGRRLRRVRLAAGVGAAVIASFVVCQLVTARSQPWAFFGLHTRIWQLGAGALAATLWAHVDRVPDLLRRVAAPAGLAVILATAVLVDDGTPWPGSAALYPTLGTLIVLLGPARAPTTALLSARPLQWIGARSYSWYLWHWPSLVFFAAWRDIPVADVSTGTALVVAAVSLAIGHIGYELVEQPIRHRRTLVRVPRLSIAVGLSFTLVCLAGLLVVRPFADRIGDGGVATAAIAATPNLGMTRILDEATLVQRVPSNLRPSLADVKASLSDVYRNGCHVSPTDVEPLVCDYGDVKSDTVVVLTGDSHAAHWVPALDLLAERSRIRLVPMTKSGCAIAEVPINSPILERAYGECDVWRENLFESVDRLQPDLVITTQSSSFELTDVPESERNERMRSGYVASLRRLSRSADSIVVLSDTPYAVGDIPTCLSQRVDNVPGCVIDRSTSFAQRLTDVERDAAATAGARYVMVDELFCGRSACPVIVGDVLVYRDRTHITPSYMTWIAPSLARLLGPPWTATASGD